MRKLPSFCVVLSVALLSACSGKSAPEGKAGEGGQGKPAVAVDVYRLAPTDLSVGVEAVGSLSPKFETVVRAEIKSRVTDVYVTQWVPVRAGMELSRSDTREIEAGLAAAKASVEAAKSQEEAARAQAEIANAQADAARAEEESGRAGLREAEVGAERAEREYQRVVGLVKEGLATRQSQDEALSARDAARARVEAVRARMKSAASQIAAAQAQMGAAKAGAGAAGAQSAAAREEVKRLETLLSKAVVRSPMNGVVAERMVNVGDLPGDGPLFRIVDNSVLNLTLSVPAKDQAALKVGQALTFTVDALPGETFTGKVMYINPTVSPADRSIGVVAEVGNQGGRLKGGLFAKARIVTGDLVGVFTLPKSALTSWEMAGRTAQVFTVASGVAKKKKITVGATQGDLIQVTGGIGAGEEVVVRGGFSLKEGDRVVATQAGVK